MPLIKRIVKMSLGISVFIFVILNIVPEFFLSFYSQGDEFIAEAVPIVRIVSVALLMMSVGTIWLNAVTGTGNSRVNLLIELVTIVIYCVYVIPGIWSIGIFLSAGAGAVSGCTGSVCSRWLCVYEVGQVEGKSNLNVS